jgi:hypothetical protein
MEVRIVSGYRKKTITIRNDKRLCLPIEFHLPVVASAVVRFAIPLHVRVSGFPSHPSRRARSRVPCLAHETLDNGANFTGYWRR